MGQQPKPVITDAPWIGLTYEIIGLAMALHNELGPGHRESVYHNGMVIKLQDRPIISKRAVRPSSSPMASWPRGSAPIWW